MAPMLCGRARMDGPCIRGRTALQDVSGSPFSSNQLSCLNPWSACTSPNPLFESVPQLNMATAVLHAEDRVLWYSAQYRDWDVTNGTLAQEVRLVSSLLRSCLVWFPCLVACQNLFLAW